MQVWQAGDNLRQPISGGGGGGRASERIRVLQTGQHRDRQAEITRGKVRLPAQSDTFAARQQTRDQIQRGCNTPIKSCSLAGSTGRRFNWSTSSCSKALLWLVGRF